MPNIEDTIAFIKEAHAGQVDKAGNEYYLHPFAVMKRLPEDADEEVKLAALLHDVIEDTVYQRDDLLRMGYTERTLTAIELVSQQSDDDRPYAEKINDIIASGNKDAIAVKYADMSENCDPDRLALLEEPTRARLLKKYTNPLSALRIALS